MDENTNLVADEMVLDMGAINFFELEDPNIKTVEKKAAQKTQPVEEVVEDVEEVVEEDGEDAEDIDFDSLDSDEEETTEDEVEETEEVEEEDSSDESEEEVDYEGYEVTLPNGDVVNLSEAVRGYQNAEVLRNEREEFESKREEFVRESENVSKYLELARLEAQRVVDDYADFDWNKEARENPESYVDNRQFLEKYTERLNEIQKAMGDIEAKKEAQREEALQTKARECVTVLNRDITGWGPDLYQTLMKYAVENGADSDEIQNCVDPIVFKALYKAYQFDKGKATVTAKVKKVVTSPKKVVKTTAKEVKPADAKKVTLSKKLTNGSYDSRDVDAMFNMLED